MLNLESLTQGAVFETIIFVLGGIVLIAFVVLSVILNHHWTSYGVGKKQIKHLRRTYFGVSAVFLLLMLVGTLVTLIGA